MNNTQTTHFSGRKNFFLIAMLILIVFVVGVLFVWRMVLQADYVMRADLLQQAHLVAQSLNIENLRALSGSEVDLKSSDYLLLKEKLAAICSINPQYRFVYLMGRKGDGTVFFFADSEPATSKDYSPPGQVYEEVSENIRRVFNLSG